MILFLTYLTFFQTWLALTLAIQFNKLNCTEGSTADFLI